MRNGRRAMIREAVIEECAFQSASECGTTAEGQATGRTFVLAGWFQSASECGTTAELVGIQRLLDGGFQSASECGTTAEAVVEPISSIAARFNPRLNAERPQRRGGPRPAVRPSFNPRLNAERPQSNCRRCATSASWFQSASECGTTAEEPAAPTGRDETFQSASECGTTAEPDVGSVAPADYVSIRV